MRERDIEKHLVQRVKALGGECRKVVWQGRRGAPDRLVMLPDSWWWHCRAGSRGYPGPFFVELKAPGEKPRPEQKREHDRMRECHCRVFVIDSIEGVEELLA